MAPATFINGGNTMDWLTNKVMAIVLIAALGITAGASVYNAKTAKELLNAEKQMLEAAKSSGTGSNLPQKEQGSGIPGQDQTSILKQIEQHLANIDGIFEQKKKAEEQETNHLKHYFKAPQVPLGTGKTYGPNDIH
jgi:hypothetical protein